MKPFNPVLLRKFLSLRNTLEPLGFRLSVIYTPELFACELSAPSDYSGALGFGCDPCNVSQILVSLSGIFSDVINYIYSRGNLNFQ